MWKRKILTGVAIGLLLLAVAPATHAQYDCGDVNEDGSINISDIVYLINWMYLGGPPPLDPDNADTDGCPPVDINDIDVLVTYLFQGGPEPCSTGTDCSLYPGGIVSLDEVEGAFGSVIPTGVSPTFKIRFYNDESTYIRSFANGFRFYSPDGADVSVIAADTAGGLYDLFPLLVQPGALGLSDTIGLSGAAFTYNGFEPGYNEIVLTITLDAFDADDVGKTVCIDSSFFGQAGYWKWCAVDDTQREPAWGGPYCFTIEPQPDGMVSLDGVTGYGAGMDSLPSGFESTFLLRYSNNSGMKVDGFTTGFRVHSPDGATWTTTTGDSTGALSGANFDLVHLIDYFSVTGSGADTVLFGGAALSGDGIPPGFDDVPYTITVGPIPDSSVGKTLCLDSCWAPPSGPWAWQTMSGVIVPAWDGPHCFDIYQPTIPPWELVVTPDTLGFTAYEGGANPPSQFFHVGEVHGDSIPFQCDWIESFVNLPQPTGSTPADVQVDVSVAGYAPGDYYSTIVVSSPDAVYPEEVVVKLTIEPMPVVGDSVIVPSVDVGYGVCRIQPVNTKLIQPIRGATIPLKIPDGMVVCSLSTAGLMTEAWDYTYSVIEPADGWILMALANSFEDVIPVGENTVFNIYFYPTDADCAGYTHIHWDTALSGDPVRNLLFADTADQDVQVGFDRLRDSTGVPPYIPGDMNGSGFVDIGSLIYLVNYMFQGGPPPQVMDAADVNGSCTGPNIADLTYLVSYMFNDGPPPQCGCLGAGPKLNGPAHDGIILTTRFQNGQTVISLNSAVELRGIQLEMQGAGSEADNLISDRWNIAQGLSGDESSVGLFDMDGRHTLKGLHDLLIVDGRVEIVSALVSDVNHQEWQPVIDKNTALPGEFALHQNYPNPFNPTTQIGFSLQQACHARLEVFNIVGQRVTTLIDGDLEAGRHEVTWDAGQVSSGVYFYRLTARDYTATRKMMLLK